MFLTVYWSLSQALSQTLFQLYGGVNQFYKSISSTRLIDWSLVSILAV